jgi:hypothetical protein
LSRKGVLAFLFSRVVVLPKEQVGRWKVNKTEEKPLGRVTHYYSHLGVIIIELTGGELNASEQDFSKFGP